MSSLDCIILDLYVFLGSTDKDCVIFNNTISLGRNVLCLVHGATFKTKTLLLIYSSLERELAGLPKRWYLSKKLHVVTSKTILTFTTVRVKNFTRTMLHKFFIFSPTAQQPLVGQGILIIEASRSLSDTSYSVGLLWTSDQPHAETSTWQHTTLTREKSGPPMEFEPAIPARERPQTHALDSAATGIGYKFVIL
jgi:hypothetical protein